MNSYHGKQDAQDRKHPQPVDRKGSAIGVPSGSRGPGAAEDSNQGSAQVAHGVPGGGRRVDTPAYAVPKRSRPSPTATEHRENASARAGSLPGVGTPNAGGPGQIHQQPRVPFDQLSTAAHGSGQGFPYGSAKAGFGFDRLRG